MEIVPSPSNLDDICINTLRTLAMDAVQKANSGHPGAPMGLAAAAYILWTKILKHNPKNPSWPDRDRFVLSGGHASVLLYSLLHLSGYDLSLDDIKNFRQWKSKTPGHPEYGCAPGVETTTGPLGQGFTNAVGMALAERHLAAVFNRPGNDIVNHYTYVMCGDGDFMEGVTSEAASFAGHLGLSKLICIYDSNQISIEGTTDLTFTEDVESRFRAYNWHVLRVNDGNDTGAIFKALNDAKHEAERPSLIILRTHIAFGSPNKQDSASAHGEPLGEDEVRLTKKNLAWPEDSSFMIPEQALKIFRKSIEQGEKAEAGWKAKFESYGQVFPELAERWIQDIKGELADGWDSNIPVFGKESGAIATRSASGQIVNGVAENLPALIGGSADLAPSNKTLIRSSHDFQKGAYDGRNIRFGVREHAMGAILSGLALHKGLIPYGGTFLVFADYMRPAIRLASLMKLHVIYVFTHDSIAVGEDGPTHQPVEHLASLRAIPGLTVIRPADATETAEAWRQAIRISDGPVALILSRQNLPVLDRTRLGPAEGLAKGGYILSDPDGKPEIIIIATGSEVHISLEAAGILRKNGIKARVVSMPSIELFEKNPQEYKDRVLIPDIKSRVIVEAGLPMGWERYAKGKGAFIGITRFGASAPGGILMEKFGFTADVVVKKCEEIIAR
ncbi:MAG: transketolase [Deltaproteobacteria bacterium]|nr:transketolase [Deltaproteobacteria bacterium]